MLCSRRRPGSIHGSFGIVFCWAWELRLRRFKGKRTPTTVLTLYHRMKHSSYQQTLITQPEPQAGLWSFFGQDRVSSLPSQSYSHAHASEKAYLRLGATTLYWIYVTSTNRYDDTRGSFWLGMREEHVVQMYHCYQFLAISCSRITAHM
jgi:hypothetical protein